MTMVERLVALAEELAEKSGKSLTLKRRAVSTAYYAMFHTLAELCADELLGAGSDTRSEEYIRVYRSLEHGTLKTAFKTAPLNRTVRIAEDRKSRGAPPERTHSLRLSSRRSNFSTEGSVPRPR